MVEKRKELFDHDRHPEPKHYVECLTLHFGSGINFEHGEKREDLHHEGKKDKDENHFTNLKVNVNVKA